MDNSKPKNIGQYICKFPQDVQEKLTQIRSTIAAVIPQATETISYSMPTFNINGKYLIYFAAYKKHIGIYPVPKDLNKIDKAFGNCKTSGKGTIKFSHDKPFLSTSSKS